MTNFQNFRNEWLGKRIDYDHVYAYQCVDLVLQYVYECYGLGSGVRGNAIDYWNSPSPALLTKFHKQAGSDAKEGNIVVLNGLPGNPYGHIGIATGGLTGTTLEILEQNGATGNGSGTGGDAIRTRWIDRGRVAGLLVQNDQPAPAPPPAPAPAPAPSGANYDGHSITIQPGWGLSNAAQAAGFPDAGTPARWENIASLNGSNDWQAFNHNLKAGQRIVVGTYQAPAPAPAVDLPQKPANIVFTRLAEPMSLVVNRNTHEWDLGFADDAHATSVADLAEGTAFVAVGKGQRTDRDRPAYFMSADDFGNADQTGLPNRNVGVNTVDLSPTPAPQPAAPAPAPEPVAEPVADGEKIDVKVDWKSSYTAFLSPQSYIANKNVTVTDLDEEAEITPTHPAKVQLVSGAKIMISGTFTRNGAKYYRTSRSVKAGNFYGIPEDALDKESDLQEDSLMAEIEKNAPQIRKELNTQQTREKVYEAVGSVTGFISKPFHRKKN